MSPTQVVDNEPYTSRATAPPMRIRGPGFSGSVRLYALLVILLSVSFCQPLLALARLASIEPLYSHVGLIPIISLYLIWLKRHDLRQTSPQAALSTPRRWPFIIPLVFGMLGLFSWFMASPQWKGEPANTTSLLAFSYLCFVWTLSVAVFGWDIIRRLLFPVSFLVFMVPFPVVATQQIEALFQHASAEAASLLFSLSPTPVLRNDLFFQLPGITLQVAQECSGIRSTLVLFITSLLGGYMFFEFPRHRAILALVVIPIAILRNGLRIFTIGLLCVYISPDMIHSIIHRRGGPLFFALSLIPLFAVLIFLYRRERRLKVKGS